MDDHPPIFFTLAAASRQLLAATRDYIPHMKFDNICRVTGFANFKIYVLQHNFKKIRNNIEKSNKSTKPRCLTLGSGKQILRTHLVEAYNFDQGKTSIHIHEKLSEQHFHLDPAAKMQNLLAEEVLNKQMLYLMVVS